MTRAEWKKLYRLMRIVRRETTKANQDMILFGTGYVQIGLELADFCQHIPIENVGYS